MNPHETALDNLETETHLLLKRLNERCEEVRQGQQIHQKINQEATSNRLTTCGYSCLSRSQRIEIFHQSPVWFSPLSIVGTTVSKQLRDLTPISSLPLSSVESGELDPTKSPTLDRPMKHRISMPSRAVMLNALNFSRTSSGKRSRRFRLNREAVLVLAAPIAALMGLVSLVLLNQSAFVQSSVAQVGSNKDQGTQIDSASLYNRAKRLVERGEFEVAVQTLPAVPETSTQRERISSEILRRAQAYYPNDLKAALRTVSSVPSDSDSYSKAQRLASDWNQQLVWVQTSDYALEQQQWDEAANYLEKLRSTPISSTEWFKQIEPRVRQRNQSIPDLKDVAAHYNVANIYDQKAQYSLAETHYRQAARAGSPVRDRAINNLARIYLLQNRVDEATALLQQELDRVTQPSIRSAFYKNLGWAAYQQQNWNDALKWLEQSTELDPTRADTYCLLAKTRKSMKQDSTDDRTTCLMLKTTEDQPEVQQWQAELLE